MEPDRDEARTGAIALDPEFVTGLYRAHAEPLRRFVLGLLRDPELASDVVQTTFAKAVEQGAGVSTDAWKSWLFRVAYHEAITARRRRTTRLDGERRLGERSPQLSFGPEDAAVREEAVRAVRDAMDDLPDEQVKVVRARVYEGLTFAEIARNQGIPLGTVLARMHRALDRLRRSIPPEVEP